MICNRNRISRAFLLREKLAGFVLGLLFVAGGAQVCIPADPGPVSPQTITGRLSGQNGFAWRYGYDIEFRDGKVFVKVAINLIAAGGVTKLELDRVKPVWGKGIESIWSEKFSIGTPAGQQYPIVIDVTFNGSRFHHEVIVRPGGGRSDQLNWNILDRPATVAHEFGHMVGVYDEYRRGATAPQSAIIDRTIIMTSNPTAGMAYARHYKGFLTWFAGQTSLSDIALVAIESGQRQCPPELQTGGKGQIKSNRKLVRNIRARVYP
jgi:serralysin